MFPAFLFKPVLLLRFELLGQVTAILTQHTIFNDVAIVREFSHPCCFMRTVFFTELVFYALEFYGGHRLLE